MTSRLLISLSLALFAWQTAVAQLAPPNDFFNGGAQLYISNNVPAALARVESGLKEYPDDVKLKKLEQLLKQQQQQQQQQQNQQQQDRQKDQQSSQSNQQDQQKQDEQKQSPAEPKKEDQPKQQGQQKSSAQKKQNEKPENQEAEPVKEGQLTTEEAKRLLDAQKDSEQLLRWKPKENPRNSLRPVKDW